MKKSILLIVTLIAGGIASAQITDTVSIGAGYANENYFTISTGNEVSVVRNNWDLAFASSGLGGGTSTIRINGATGTELYKFSNSISGWSTVDTTGFSWSNKLINSDTTWRTGAFDNFALSSAFDLGWGTYNATTHIVTGDKIFIIKLSDGSYKKMIVVKLQGGVFTIKYANVDGTNELTRTISKSNYTGKNFGYFSIQNDTAIDREPASATWDLLFTKYITLYGGHTPYGVSGVVANHGVKVAQVNNVGDVNTVSAAGQNYSNIISTIGYDWKSYSFSLSGYVIEDSLVYFVEDIAGDVYKVIFTGFGGGSNGNFIFTRQQVGTAGIVENNATAKILNLFPNPATNFVNLTFIGGNEFTQISVMDVSGKLVYNNQIRNQGLNQEKINVSNLNKGVYFVSVITEKGKNTKKLIIR